jgi:hypothetical protein
MIIHLLAAVLAGGIALGDSGKPVVNDNGKPVVADNGKTVVSDTTPPIVIDNGQPAATDNMRPVVTDATIEAAARDMRIQIYETFREDRPEYDRRLAAWVQVNKAWHAAGCLIADREKMIHWLADAESQSRADSVGALPDAPKFTPAPVAEQGPESMQWLVNLGAEMDSAAPLASTEKKPAASTDKEAGPNLPLAGPTADLARPKSPQVNVTSFIRDLVTPTDGGANAPQAPAQKSPSGN